MKTCLPVVLFCLAPVFSQTTTTTYEIPAQGCVHLSNCILYGPAESWSLWEADSQPPLPVSDFAIFNVYSWVDGFSVVDTYPCLSQSYTTKSLPGPAPKPTLEVTASCSGVDHDKGLPFSMTYLIYAYSYYSRGGGGRGGGGAGTRYWVTGGTVTLTH